MSATLGLEAFAKDLGVQEYWMRRFIAILIDWVLCLVLLSLLGLEPFAFKILSGGALAGPLLFTYTVALEYVAGQTLGKIVMGLRVVGVGSKVDLSRLLVREVSKMFAPALVLDLAAGLLVGKQGRQRYLEVLSDTTEVLDRR